jgi:hypothetical protein
VNAMRSFAQQTLQNARRVGGEGATWREQYDTGVGAGRGHTEIQKRRNSKRNHAHVHRRKMLHRRCPSCPSRSPYDQHERWSQDTRE